MHCICEGIVDQHLEKWFGSGENTLFPCSLGGQIEDIDKNICSIKPPSEITRKPRKLSERHDWKASEKKALLLYYSTPLLMGRLPIEYLQHYMLLVGAIHRLLKCSISAKEVDEATLFLKLYCAQATGFYGERFQTYNFHHLLHLGDDVKQLGPLWTHSCFPFEDYNGDLKDLFHGTQNIPGQIIQSISLLQRIPEVAAKTRSAKVKQVFNHMMNRSVNRSSKTEAIGGTAFVVGALEKGRSDGTSKDLDEDIEAVRKSHGQFGDFWTFKRCLVLGTMYHSEAYKVTVRNNFTAQIGEESAAKQFGSITRFVKVADACRIASCCVKEQCSCNHGLAFYAVMKELKTEQTPLFTYSIQGSKVISHIEKVVESGRRLAVPVDKLLRKLLRVDVSSGAYICEMPNTCEKD